MPQPFSLPIRRTAGLLIASAAFIATTPALAQDADTAWASLQRPSAMAAPAAVRGAPVLRLEWEQRLRAADRLGPAPQTAASAALLQAAQAGRWSDVKRLIKQPLVDINTRDEAGANLLVLVARHDQVELLRLLVGQGAELDRIGDDGFTALGAAAFAGHRATVRTLLRAGADPQRLGAGGQTALHLASVAGHTAVLEEFLRQGVSLELLNRQRESALDVAAAAGQIEALGWLLDHGADPSLAGQR